MDQIHLTNHHIARAAKLSEQELMERVANVRTIRAKEVPVYLSIADASKMALIQGLHTAIHTGEYQFDQSPLAPTDHIFSIELPTRFHQWLQQNTWKSIYGQLINWMAAECGVRKARRKVWVQIQKEVTTVARMRYSKHGDFPTWAEEYEQARQTFTTGDWSDILRNPFVELNDQIEQEEAMRSSVVFNTRFGYFNSGDWLSVVTRDQKQWLKENEVNLALGNKTLAAFNREKAAGKIDTMNRAESYAPLWQAWQESMPHLSQS
jgi:hypothetical protein